MPDLAVSSWSLHRTLGPIYPALDVHPGERAAELPYGPGHLCLLDAPAYVAALGISAFEVCHFHFPCTDPAYLARLRHSFAVAGVRLATLLIDAGDVAAADVTARERDIARIKDWIDVAAAVGATRVRVIAGITAADPEGRAVQASTAAFRRLVDYACTRGVAVITENWLALAARPANLLALLDGVGRPLGLCADLGNYGGPTREADLRAILPRAVTVHAKADWIEPGAVDAAAFQQCLDWVREAGFSGTYVLIFDAAGDERASLLHLADVVRPYLAA